jgi:hypothetical protein
VFLRFLAFALVAIDRLGASGSLWGWSVRMALTGWTGVLRKMGRMAIKIGFSSMACPGWDLKTLFEAA